PGPQVGKLIRSMATGLCLAAYGLAAVIDACQDYSHTNWRFPRKPDRANKSEVVFCRRATRVESDIGNPILSFKVAMGLAIDAAHGHPALEKLIRQLLPEIVGPRRNALEAKPSLVVGAGRGLYLVAVLADAFQSQQHARDTRRMRF